MRHALILLLLLLAARAARAQESGQVGLEFGSNAVGVIFHLSDTIAVRPEVTFAVGGSATSDINAWGVGASALFYLNHVDKLSTYFVPRFMYQRSSTSGGLSGFELITNTYDVSGSFGAQYALHRRFSVFGEVGLLIRDVTSNGSGIVISSTSVTSARPLTGIGAILYFK
jgi:hypothetical protein